METGLHRPAFVVSSPRAGSTLLYQVLSRSPDAWTIGGESHEVIEVDPTLHPCSHGWESNCLGAADATPAVVGGLAARFRARLRDRHGRRPAAGERPTMLEKTPRNLLRVPFLAAAFPGARFVYLYRDPVETISSLLEGWRSGRFVSYPDLPGWDGPSWSFPLVPGWRQLRGRPLAEIATVQWCRMTTILLADLAGLPPDRWCVAHFGRLVEDPAGELGRICAFLGWACDAGVAAPLPPSGSGLSPPVPEKWRRHAEELRPVLPLAAETARVAHTVAARRYGAPFPATGRGP